MSIPLSASTTPTSNFSTAQMAIATAQQVTVGAWYARYRAASVANDLAIHHCHRGLDQTKEKTFALGQVGMRSQAMRATPSKRRGISPETEAEREAKRIHTESHVLREAEDGMYVKDEETSEGDTIQAANTLNRHLETGYVSTGRPFDSLDESIRLLALSFDTHNDDDLIRAAFQTVLKRRLEQTSDGSVPTFSQPNLEQWFSELLRKQELPDESLASICTALRTAELDQVIQSWSSSRSSDEITAAVGLLQVVHEHGHTAISHVIHALQALRPEAETVQAQVQSPRKPTVANKVTRIAKSADPAPKATKSRIKAKVEAIPKTRVNELTLLTMKASSSRGGGSDQTPDMKNAVVANRGKSAPPVVEERQKLEPKKRQQFPPSSSPAIIETFKGHDGSSSRRYAKSAAKRSIESGSKAMREARPAQPSKPRSSSSTLVRWIKPDEYNLLVFFIGPAIRDIPHKDIATACHEAFGKQPVHSCLWNEITWVVQINAITGIPTNVLTLQAVEFTASETNSDPQSHFVTHCSDPEVENEVLTTAIEAAVADHHPKRSPGRVTIYRSFRTDGQGSYVFLVLSKVPPKPLLHIFIPKVSGDGQYLMFKPAIMDCDSPCFYCRQTHDEFVCPDAAQISKFKRSARR